MGSGSSGLRGGGGGTPSGVTMAQFQQMSEDEKYDFMEGIAQMDSDELGMPDYLDNSYTSRLLYALGMNNKPTVVDDATLDSMPGKEIYRAVYEDGPMPPPSTDAILDQIRNGDYTQLSGKGGSAHGRAIYFATDFGDSRMYGEGERNAMMMRAKINPTANIRSENSLINQMNADSNFKKRTGSWSYSSDEIAAYALSHGIDGWFSGTYTMIVNRGVLTASSKNKSILKKGSTATSVRFGYNDRADSWAEAGDA